MMGPLPVDVVIGCTQGPPDEPPERPHELSHQFAEPFVPMSCAQYMKLGSFEYE